MFENNFCLLMKANYVKVHRQGFLFLAFLKFCGTLQEFGITQKCHSTAVENHCSRV